PAEPAPVPAPPAQGKGAPPDFRGQRAKRLEIPEDMLRRVLAGGPPRPLLQEVRGHPRAARGGARPAGRGGGRPAGGVGGGTGAAGGRRGEPVPSVGAWGV